MPTLTLYQQWQGLIAINYPARKFGLNRHITITEAKKLCPELIMQHVATWKEGDEKWAYHKDAFANIATHKVSLDPYRLESRRILACIKDVLPAPPLQRVEKASVDEVFLDLSSQIHSILLERYPEISGPAPYDDPTEFLPRPPTTALDWNTDALVDLDSSETEDDDPDWDDIAILLGSEIVRSVRAAIRERLKYTCSAGIARNKMIAKLGSAHKKPNQQTIVRNRAVQQFMGGFKFTKIRNLGGKLGDEVVNKFETDQVKELLAASIQQLKSRLGDDTGTWVYNIIRGEDPSEVNARTQIKSMLSAKSFRPTINTSEQAVRWLRIFVADIQSRLVEEGVFENKRRPKVLSLHHRQGAQMRSRQASIPSGRNIDESLLFDIAKNLLGQIVVDGRAWPCSNLQLSVGGFEDGLTGNHGIGGFLVRGEEAKAMMPSTHDADDEKWDKEIDQSSKRRKVEHGAIQQFFSKQKRQEERCSDAAEIYPTDREGDASSRDTISAKQDEEQPGMKMDETQETVEGSARASALQSAIGITTYSCHSCRKKFPITVKEEHEDWHMAQKLQAKENSISSSGPGKVNKMTKMKKMDESSKSKSKKKNLPPQKPDQQQGQQQGQQQMGKVQIQLTFGNS